MLSPFEKNTIERTRQRKNERATKALAEMFAREDAADEAEMALEAKQLKEAVKKSIAEEDGKVVLWESKSKRRSFHSSSALGDCSPVTTSVAASAAKCSASSRHSSSADRKCRQES